MRAIYLSTGDLDRAEECVQEAMVRAWQRWNRFHSDDPVRWVQQVAWRLAVSDWRGRKRLAKALVRHGATTRLETPPPDAAILEVEGMLQALPKDQRTVVVLHYLEDVPVAEVAEILGVPEGTVKSRLSRARTKLADRLGSGVSDQ